ncbi:MAG: hypothetical protein EU536_02265 [Promethearchaeota archaeon]|nr:MAG: hypothetical protein EU536_02265 [Candidatus Lokiarchaeota archaeon]
MVKEKLGFADRMIAKIGKHWLWWRAKKSNGLLLNLAIRETLRSLMDIYDADLPTALQAFYEMGIRAGNDLMFEWLDTVKRLLAKNIKDLVVVIESAWYSFLGQEISEITHYERSEDIPECIVWTTDKCILCGGMKNDESLLINENTLGPNLNYGDFASGVFQAALQMLVDYLELPYTVYIKETRCILRGDQYPEFTAWFYPKEEQ